MPIVNKFLEDVKHRKWGSIKGIVQYLHPSEIADLMKELPENEKAVLFRLLPIDSASQVFEYLDIDEQKDLIKLLGQQQVAAILNEMSPDDRTAFLEELPSHVLKETLSLLTDEERKVASSLLGYPEDSVGRLMTPDFIAVKKEWTVEKVIDFIRQNASRSETINVLYVVNDKGQLIDDLRISQLIIQPSERKIEEIMDYNFVHLNVMDKAEEAVELFKQYDRVAMPVLTQDNTLVGIVTHDDILDIIEESHTEDIQRFGGMESLDMPYDKTPLLEMVKKRGVWLVVLFLGEMLTATAMARYEDQIAKAVVLAVFIPLIISSGGNSGSQAATLIIRAMALSEITLSDWWRVMKKEVVSGLLLGLFLGILGFGRIFIYSIAFPEVYGDMWLALAIIVGISLIGVVMWGTFSGSMLPFLLKKLKIDPAASSAPFVATLVDVTGLIIYFTVASIVMGPAFKA
jgi:magnesium transporter